ncbi:diguanylate cyclase [Methylobacter sp. S3L5C]|uniref:GGDEF domain-containing response regulator n=1 Tax=Methylobacter sp. S3L5C TaxID=2839024 RepID=UPI001FABFF62|nr:diguanylate cyclase [Methylobacter sp. S3L5C]UOA08210.1 diguanylate cyclase [Methylobacter sp. S3L5C]
MIITQHYPMILIVDDMPVNIKILAEALGSGYRIKVANNGKDALEIAEREQPDLILLDIMMPKMNGFEVCRHLKENAQTCKIAVMFLTLLSGEINEEQGLNLGAVDYITKPIAIPIVKARIRNHIQLKQQADLLESLAMIDALTLIPNHRRFDETLVSEWRRAMRDKTSLSLLEINVDYFKGYIDEYGYGIGDILLKMLAITLAKNLERPGDFIARYNNDTFMVILPDADEKTALQIAEGLRESVEKLGVVHIDSTAGFVTISVGVATKIAVSQNLFPKILCEAANSGVNSATKNGGNQVSVYVI